MKKIKKNTNNGNEIGELKVHAVVVYRMKEMKILTAEMKYMPDQYFDIKITLTLSQSHNSQDINNLPREIQTCLRNKTYLSSQVIIIKDATETMARSYRSSTTM